jgi:hypothetical protein
MFALSAGTVAHGCSIAGLQWSAQPTDMITEQLCSNVWVQPAQQYVIIHQWQC